MAKIERAHQKVFCDNVAATDNVAQFGSLKAAAIQFSKDPAIIQGLASFEEGWKSAVVTNNAPALQDMNALFYLLSRQAAYGLQAGIPEWHADTTYFQDDYCRSGKVLYCSLINDNLGFAVTDTSKWAKVFEPSSAGGSLGDVPVGAVIATMPHMTGAYNCTATTAADAKGFVLCGGQTIADASSPMNGQVVPNINNDVFLMGTSTASGVAGGANSYTLSVAQLPSHNHTMAHDHAIDHNHASFDTASGGSHTHGHYTVTGVGVIVTGPYIQGRDSTENRTARTGEITSTGSSHTHTIDLPTFTGTSGPSSAANTGNQGSGSSIDNRPKYITAKYVMRVK